MRLPFRAAPKCLRGVTAKRGYLGGVSKFLGFLLGVAVALAGPAVFGVLAAPGGIEPNAKEMAAAFGIAALIFWAVASYFSGAGALGAFVAFGALIYCWLWIPNRTTNFLNDAPGVTTGMIEGSKRYTLNGLVPILAVISLVYAIQLIVRSVQRRRRERVEADRLQREQEAAQAQQEADAAALYPGCREHLSGVRRVVRQRGIASTTCSTTTRSRSSRATRRRSRPTSTRPPRAEHTAQFRGRAPPKTVASGNYPGDDTVLVPTDRRPDRPGPGAPAGGRGQARAPVAAPCRVAGRAR